MCWGKTPFPNWQTLGMSQHHWVWKTSSGLSCSLDSQILKAIQRPQCAVLKIIENRPIPRHNVKNIFDSYFESYGFTGISKDSRKRKRSPNCLQ